MACAASRTIGSPRQEAKEGINEVKEVPGVKEDNSYGISEMESETEKYRAHRTQFDIGHI
jgi:hypothetical protein